MTYKRAAEGVALLGIAAVERDTGVPKDTLRAWERRYGFPRPQRDDNDERSYPFEQVAKLRLLRRLVDAGYRPGKIVGLAEPELAALLQPADAAGGRTETAQGADILGFLAAYDATGLRDHLQALLLRAGLRAFVTEVAPGLATAVGAAWAEGDLEIHQEHLFTEQFATVLRGAINAVRSAGAGPDRPRVLLTTVPQEPHSLGLLMAEAMLVLAGCACVSLGVQTPIPDIAAAARAHRADLIALSFSALVPAAQAQAALADLRAIADPATDIWAGGAGAALRPLSGVTLIPSLAAIDPVVAAWRESALRRGPSP